MLCVIGYTHIWCLCLSAVLTIYTINNMNTTQKVKEINMFANSSIICID